jgi:transaldolase
LRFFIDSVEKKDWQRYLSTGLFFGVTTNPKLIAKSGIPFEIDHMEGLAVSAFDLGAKEIHIQVWGETTENMLKIGRELSSIDPRVMVKVPITAEGLKCANQLISEGSSVTLTAVHAAEQALIAAALGAKYAAPYLGRMNDGGLNGLEEIIFMQRIIKNADSNTRLLVASIREIKDLVKLSEQGLHTFTLLPKLIDQLMSNELTDLATDDFEAAVNS